MSESDEIPLILQHLKNENRRDSSQIKDHYEEVKEE